MTMTSTRRFDAASLYRAVWRWHFYAGLLVLPFLASLSVTGALYLFHDEIDAAVYRDWTSVAPRAAAPLPLQTVVANVEAVTGAKAAKLTVPDTASDTVRIVLSGAQGKLTAFADPYDGHIVGSAAGTGVMGVVREVHSLAIGGFWANCLIEIVAGWTMLLVASGIYLWWPRGQDGGVVTVRGRPGGRLFWRDLHAVTGLFAGGVVFFLAATGLPWSAVWGDGLNSWINANGYGRPAAPVVSEHEGHGGDATLPWALHRMRAPMAMAKGDIGVDAALAAARGAGLTGPATLLLPTRPGQAYTISARIKRADDAHVAYVDPASGRVLANWRAADFGAGVRAVEWGIAVHQGEQYGDPNRYLMLAGALAVLLLAVSAAMMWWKRRPAGSLGVPSAPVNPKAVRGVGVLVALFGLIFPLVGVSLLAALAIDLALGRLRRPKMVT